MKSPSADNLEEPNLLANLLSFYASMRQEKSPNLLQVQQKFTAAQENIMKVLEIRKDLEKQLQLQQTKQMHGKVIEKLIQEREESEKQKQQFIQTMKAQEQEIVELRVTIASYREQIRQDQITRKGMKTLKDIDSNIKEIKNSINVFESEEVTRDTSTVFEDENNEFQSHKQHVHLMSSFLKDKVELFNLEKQINEENEKVEGEYLQSLRSTISLYNQKFKEKNTEVVESSEKESNFEHEEKELEISSCKIANEYEKQVLILKDKYQKEKQQKEKLKKDLERLEKKLSDVEGELNKQNQLKQSLEKELREEKGKASHIEQRLSEEFNSFSVKEYHYNEEIEELRKKVKSMEDQTITEKKAWDQQYCSVKRDLEKVEEKYQKGQENYERLTCQQEKKKKQNENNLNLLRGEMRELKNEGQKKEQLLSTQINLKEEEIHKLKWLLGEKDEEIGELKEGREKEYNEKSEKEKELRELRQQLKTSKGKVEKAEAKYKEIQKANTLLDKDFQYLEGMKNEESQKSVRLEQKLEAKTQQFNLLEKQLFDLREKQARESKFETISERRVSPKDAQIPIEEIGKFDEGKVEDILKEELHKYWEEKSVQIEEIVGNIYSLVRDKFQR